MFSNIELTFNKFLQEERHGDTNPSTRGKLRQEEQELKVSLGYIITLCLEEMEGRRNGVRGKGRKKGRSQRGKWEGRGEKGRGGKSRKEK